MSHWPELPQMPLPSLITGKMSGTTGGTYPIRISLGDEKGSFFLKSHGRRGDTLGFDPELGSRGKARLSRKKEGDFRVRSPQSVSKCMQQFNGILNDAIDR